jgi:hypothetical protein
LESLGGVGVLGLNDTGKTGEEGDGGGGAFVLVFSSSWIIVLRVSSLGTREAWAGLGGNKMGGA